ncbi:hypothetical protein ES705_27920 [subsurface metagenome]
MSWPSTPDCQVGICRSGLTSQGFTAIPPPNVANHVSYRDVQFSDLDIGVTITVITDVPSHLFCRLTRKPPHIHKKPSLRRGVAFAEDVRFCFTVFWDNEQEEAGDTLIHTFRKPAWPVCETRWVYFYGHVAEQISPSTSPLFKHHRLLGPYTILFQEPWSAAGPPPWDILLFEETWSYTGFRIVFFEPWSEEAPPTHVLLFSEPWSEAG